VIKLTAEEE
jgi:hypothetical protein